MLKRLKLAPFVYVPGIRYPNSANAMNQRGFRPGTVRLAGANNISMLRPEARGEREPELGGFPDEGIAVEPPFPYMLS